MLNNRRLTITSDSVVDGEKIAVFGAVMDLDTLEVGLTSRYVNQEYCKAYRDIVRADRSDFEDYVYMIQDTLKESDRTEE